MGVFFTCVLTVFVKTGEDLTLYWLDSLLIEIGCVLSYLAINIFWIILHGGFHESIDSGTHLAMISLVTGFYVYRRCLLPELTKPEHVNQYCSEILESRLTAQSTTLAIFILIVFGLIWTCFYRNVSVCAV